MFIIKLGEEALNKLEEKLNEGSEPNSGIQSSFKGNNLYSYEAKLESSILYNLLSNDETSSSKTQSLLIPSHFNSTFEFNLPPRANTISYSNESYKDSFIIAPRPYSAPQACSDINNTNLRKRKLEKDIPLEFNELKTMSFYKNCKISSKSSVDSQSISCSTDSCADEPMDLSKNNDENCDAIDGKFVVDSWLFQAVSLINSTKKHFSNNLIELPPNVRLHLLQSSWHRVIVTYLFEHLMTLTSSLSDELWKFLQSVTGITKKSVLSKKKMCNMYKNLADELNVILCQIKKLNLDHEAMNYLRIGLFLTGNHDENNQKNLKLIELFIQSKIGSTESDLQIVSDLVNNLLKINSVIIETIFYGHLNESVEKVINESFTNS